ncbi:MAG: hypothetical protein Kow0081_3840 [Candidatus Dojkabacteria bacterium]
MTPNLDIMVNGNSIREYDLVFFGLMAKSLEISIFLQTYLNSNKINYIKYGGERSFYNMLNEYYHLKTNNFPVIDSYFFDIRSTLYPPGKLGYPFIIKPVKGCKGLGIKKNKFIPRFYFSFRRS